MAERHPLSIADLEVVLADLADHVEHPVVADMSSEVIARLDLDDARARHVPRPRWVPVAIAAALALIIVLALPAPRRALADWLGIGTVHVVRVNELPKQHLGSTLQLGREVPLEAARRAAPFTIFGPSKLGMPSTIYVGEPSTGSVTLLWGPSSALPPAAGTGVGVLLTEMPGSTDRTLMEKRLGPDATFEIVTVGSSVGYWIAGGQHELLYLDPGGSVRPDTTRLAANTLLWTRDGVTFRLESALDRTAAVELATHLVPLR